MATGGPRIVVSCQQCGADVECFKCRPRKFCGMACRSEAYRGTGNPKYRGGVYVRQADGRGMIVARDGKPYLFARAVAGAELGRLLRDDEVVHHVNGDCSDDRPENLTVLGQGEHMQRFHRPPGARHWEAVA